MCFFNGKYPQIMQVIDVQYGKSWFWGRLALIAENTRPVNQNRPFDVDSRRRQTGESCNVCCFACRHPLLIKHGNGNSLSMAGFIGKLILHTCRRVNRRLGQLLFLDAPSILSFQCSIATASPTHCCSKRSHSKVCPLQ